MADFLELCFSWPVLPASVLLCLITAYWLLVIAGAAEMDFLDWDLDIDLDPGLDSHASVLDWGLASLRWLNLGDVPLMIWLSALALPAWLMSMTFSRELTDPSTIDLVKGYVRDFAVGIFAAKILTQPLKGKLKFVEPNPARNLIGRTVTITTVTATTESGQAQCATGDGAPLLLHVRTLEGTIEKGREATIIDYAAEKHVYYVQAAAG